MVDPVSITGLVLQIGVTLKQLYDYGKAVTSAKSDIKRLCLELSALKSLVEDFKAQKDLVVKHAALEDALYDAQAALNELLSSLAPPGSKASRLKQSLTWPFRDGEVSKIHSRLERAKTLLMLYLMGDLPAVREDVSEIKDDVKMILANQEKQKDAESCRQILDLIAPVSSQFVHRAACAVWKDSHAGSGSWFIDGPLDCLLHSPTSQQRMIALIGISGAGKSTLISRAIDHLSANSSKHSVAYMYCMYNDAGTQNIRNILGGWIAQLWQLEPNVLERFRDYASGMDEAVPLSLLSRALVEIAESAGTVFLVLDALNECKDPTSVSSTLVDLIKRSKAIKILISSTASNPTIETLCDESTCKKVDLTAEKVQPDIRQHILQEIAKHAVLQRIPEDEIVAPVLERANGMFRWAKCQMDLLGEQATPNRVRKALDDLPETLYDTYVVLLQRANNSCKGIVREVLLWLSLSQRPLKLNELVEAVAFDVDETSVDKDCRIDPPEALIEMCHGLVVRDVATDNVTLAHGSIQSFLMSDFIRSSPVAYYAIEHACQDVIVRKCLSYLLMPQFGVGQCPTELFNRLEKEYPLLNYASKFWALHCAAQQALPQEQADLIDRLFWTQRTEPNGGHFAFWVYCIMPETDRHVVGAAEPLYYASSFGLTDVVASMLSKGWISLNEQDPWYIDHTCGRATSTALQVACWRGHLAIVSSLLQAGADPNSQNIVGATCLRCARRRGHVEIERLLMRMNAHDDFVPVDTTPVRHVGVSAIRRAIIEELDIELELVTDETDLESLGVDSLMSLMIAAKIREETGVEIPALYLLMHATIKQMEEELAQGLEAKGCSTTS